LASVLRPQELIHAVEPANVEYFPEEQRVQVDSELAPTAAEYFPAAHEVQSDEDIIDKYVPAVQVIADSALENIANMVITNIHFP
jgi:hypothetical protein